MSLKTDREKVAHLLRRFGLGTSEAELEFYAAGGLKGAINKLLDYKNTPEDFTVDSPFPDNEGKVNANPRFAQNTLYTLYLTTTRPLPYKMALFWHDHFATSAQKVTVGPTMMKHFFKLRDFSTGKFYDLLSAISTDPAMLYWLDNQDNIKGRPNENFAREVMELFTLGVGNYTEKDIQEVAKAFTGWTYGVRRNNRNIVNRGNLPGANAAFIFDKPNHDDGPKSVLGKPGNFNGDEVLRLLCDTPRTAYYITEKILNWFVFPNPDATLINRFATRFRQSDLDIEDLIRAIMESEEFYSDKAERAIIKNPIDFVVPIFRQLGLGAALAKDLNAQPAETRMRRAQQVARGATTSTTSMGMELLYPPDVAGWEGGQSWISSATIVERIKFATTILQNNVTRQTAPMAALIGGRTPAQAVDRLLSLYDVKVPDDRRAVLIKAAEKVEGGGASIRNAQAVALEVTKTLFGSPDFQFC